MDRKLRILGRTFHQGGAKWLRLTQHLDVLQRLGLAECGVVTGDDDEDLVERAFRTSDLIVSSAGAGVFHLEDGSVVAENVLRNLKTIMGSGLKWVWDVDDDHFNVNPFNPSYRYYGLKERHGDGKRTPQWIDGEGGFDLKRNLRTARAYQEILERCTALTTTTEYLRKKLLAFNPNVYIRPNVVDFDGLWTGTHRPSLDGAVRILYAGGASHFKDLEFVLPALLELAHTYDGTMGKPLVRFTFFGDTDSMAQKPLPQDRVDRIDWTSSYRIYTRRMCSVRADIGIAPLNMGPDYAEFNRSKSPVKWTEYAAIGLPAVCQNDHPYTPAVHCVPGTPPDTWTGWLAETPEEWYYALAFLIENPELRRLIGRNANLAARTDFNAVRWGETYLQQYEEIMGLHEKAVA